MKTELSTINTNRKQTMKTVSTLILSLAVVATAYAGGGNDEAKTAYQVNTKTSKIFWTGKKVTGQHNGTLEIAEGTIDVNEGQVTGGMVKMDMNTITVEDIKDPGTNAKLTGHLKSDDFFSVKDHPHAMFEITSITPAKDSKSREHTHDITGKLTIKGKTETITFPAMVKVKGDKLVARGDATFDRTKFNIRYGSDSFFDNLGDKAIDDKVEMNFVLAASKK